MKRLFQNTTNVSVLRGEFWTGISKSMAAKGKVFGHDIHTFNWVLMFMKTGGFLDPAELEPGLRDSETGYINSAVFKYIPWYLGYTEEDFKRITSVTYDPEITEIPLNMIAAQYKLLAERLMDKRNKARKQSYLAMIEGGEEKDTLYEILEDFKSMFNDPAQFLENGVPQYMSPIRLQLLAPCLRISEVIKEELKGWGYSNLAASRVRYCGANDIALPMLTTLFVMKIIKDYFKYGTERLNITSDKNIRLVRREIRKALDFETRIRTFWIAKESYSQFNQWEKDNYNTIVHNTEVQRTYVDFDPLPLELLNEEYRYNDLGIFPETSLF